ncbi:hypothetical protein NKH77_09350 [Streptomyces sp. M19]
MNARGRLAGGRPGAGPEVRRVRAPLADRGAGPGARRGAGVASFVRSQRPEAFEEDDLLLAEDLVNRAAVSWTTPAATPASTPRRSPSSAACSPGPDRRPGHGTGLRYLPADVRDGVGGDWFDVIPLSGARVALVVGTWWATGSPPP